MIRVDLDLLTLTNEGLSIAVGGEKSPRGGVAGILGKGIRDSLWWGQESWECGEILKTPITVR